MDRTLGTPDKVKPNPHYRCAAPMKLWLRGRVQEFCTIHGEKLRYTGLRRRSVEQRADKSLTGSSMRRLNTPNSLNRIGCLSEDVKRSCFNHLENRSIEHGRYDDIPKVTDRKIVNMLRHEYTNYHGLLDSLFSGSDARKRISSSKPGEQCSLPAHKYSVTAAIPMILTNNS